MSKVVGPFFGLSASKVFGKILEYRTSFGGTIVSKKHKPGSRMPFTLHVSQSNARIYMASAVESWQSLSGDEKKQWNDFVG